MADYSYLYLNPTLSREFELHEMVGLDVGVGYGYKVYGSDSSINENLHDFLFKLSLPVRLPKGFYLTPSIDLAWTDVHGRAGLASRAGLNAGVDR